MQLVDFYADWCQPCKAMTPVLEALEKEYPHVRIKKVNIDDDEKTTLDYGVMSIPTVVVEDGDMELGRLTGVVSKKEIEALFAKQK